MDCQVQTSGQEYACVQLFPSWLVNQIQIGACLFKQDAVHINTVVCWIFDGLFSVLESLSEVVQIHHNVFHMGELGSVALDCVLWREFILVITYFLGEIS